MKKAKAQAKQQRHGKKCDRRVGRAKASRRGRFAEAFKQCRGKVDPKFKLGFSRDED